MKLEDVIEKARLLQHLCCPLQLFGIAMSPYKEMIIDSQSIDFHSTLIALSSALDLVGVDEVHHGKRVAMMAHHMAQEMGWPEEESYSILVAGMLHDCGVSKNQEHRNLTETLEWDGAEEHCIRGAGYLSACPPLAHLALEIRYHHTRWETLLTLPLDEHTRRRANLIYLADRVDVLQAPFLGSELILMEFEGIISRIQTLTGTLFAADLVAAFTAAAQVQAFWLSMEPDYLDEDLVNLGVARHPTILDYASLKEVARLFSHVVDAKSPFTDEHSQRVARIARQLGSDLGLPAENLEQLEIAGLLHDIGKLRVSEGIIEKPGCLSPEERASIHRHSYDTYRILRRAFGHTHIPVWAGSHHEKLRGDGYPFGSQGNELDLECRIMSVADIFQALAQNRAYRKGTGLEEILDDLRRRVEDGEIDGIVVERLAKQGAYYYDLATRD